jgi:hypothetical protein
MRFNTILEVVPTGVFGLPEGTRTILPAPLEYESDQFMEVETGKRFRKSGWGSVSVYRQVTNRIDEELAIGDTRGRIRDNFIWLTFEADDAEEGKARVRTLVDTFLQHLALKYNITFSYNGVVMEDEEGNRYPIRVVGMPIADFRGYNLDELRQELRLVQQYVDLDDDPLSRALTYFEHALWLFERLNPDEIGSQRHRAQLASSIFLNLWKAVTAVVGDPSRDRDYQSRYRRFGLDYDFFKDGISKIKRMRDDLDVAHHSLDTTAVAHAQAAMGEALDVARQVIVQYRQYLSDQRQGAALQ